MPSKTAYHTKKKKIELKLNSLIKWPAFYISRYREYLSEPREVRYVIEQHYRIREITNIQSVLVSDFHKVWRLLQMDPNFSVEDLTQMSKVYRNILDNSLKNTDLLIHIASSFSSPMSNGQRHRLINRVGDKIEKNYRDLKHANKYHIFISLQRADSKSQIQLLRRIYGIKPLTK